MNFGIEGHRALRWNLSFVSGCALILGCGASGARADEPLFVCRFVQACDDLGNGCVLSGLRIPVTEDMVRFEDEGAPGVRQYLLEVPGFEGLAFLSVGLSGRTRLSEHRDMESVRGRAISYHGVCG